MKKNNKPTTSITMISDGRCDGCRGVDSGLSIRLGVLQSSGSGNTLTEPIGKQLSLWVREQLQLLLLTFNLWEKTFQLAWSRPPTRCCWRSPCCKKKQRSTKEIKYVGVISNIQLVLLTLKCVISPWMEKLFLNAVIIPYAGLSCHHGLPWKKQKDV